MIALKFILLLGFIAVLATGKDRIILCLFLDATNVRRFHHYHFVLSDLINEEDVNIFNLYLAYQFDSKDSKGEDEDLDSLKTDVEHTAQSVYEDEGITKTVFNHKRSVL